MVDGHSVPRQIWDPTAPEISADIPLIIGNCKDEATLFSTEDEALFHLDEAGLRDRLVKAGIPASSVAPLLAAYHRDHPRDTPSDIYFRISTDRGARWNAVRQAELKIAQGKANVYLYYFAWDAPPGGRQVQSFSHGRASAGLADCPLSRSGAVIPADQRRVGGFCPARQSPSTGVTRLARLFNHRESNHDFRRSPERGNERS